MLETDVAGVQFCVGYALGYNGCKHFRLGSLVHQALHLGHALKCIYEFTIKVTDSLLAESFVVLDSSGDDSAQNLTRQGR